MGVVQTKTLRQWEGNIYFLEKYNLNYMYTRHQHMKHNHYKLISI